jgi:hypothetical protein
MEGSELRLTATLRKRRNGEVSSTLEWRGQRPCAAMRAGSFRLPPSCSACRTLMVVFELSIDRNAAGAAKRRGGLDAGIPRAKSLCGHEGGVVPSTSVMFGVPNIDGERRTADRPQRSGAAKQRGELDAGIPRATSLCGYEGGIVPSTSAMFGMPNIDGGLRAVDRQQRSGAAKRRGELDAGIPRAKSLCGYEGRID